MGDMTNLPHDENQEMDQKALESAQAELKSPVSEAEINGQEVVVTKLDCISTQWRQTATKLLRLTDPKAYAEYRKIKYSGGPNPDLATRMKAYEFAVVAFLKSSYKIAGF